MKNNILYFKFLTLFLVILLGCKKTEETMEITPEKFVKTKSISQIKANSLKIGGEILTNYQVESVGICYDLKPNVNLNSQVVYGDTNSRSFDLTISGLVPSTKYYLRAFAIIEGKTHLGDEINAVTLDGSAPVLFIKDKNARYVSDSSTKVTYQLMKLGGWEMISSGICWGTDPNPTTSSNSIIDTIKMSEMQSKEICVPNIIFGIKYYVKAFVKMSNGVTYYSNEFSFVQGQGMSYQGGKIAYIFQNGEWGWIPGQVHGIIAYDSTFFGRWFPNAFCVRVCPEPFFINNLHNNMGLGQHNTNTIRQAQGTSITVPFGNWSTGTYYVTTDAIYAARTCLELSGNGYTDWFLPSKEELEKVIKGWSFIGNQIHHVRIDPFITNPTDDLLSSSQYDAFYCEAINIEYGGSGIFPKKSSLSFLPIRLF